MILPMYSNAGNNSSVVEVRAVELVYPQSTKDRRYE